MSNTIYIIVGKTCSGKTTVMKNLEDFNFSKMITSTTREPRVGEVHGVDYFFKTKDEFEANISKNLFIEHLYQKGNYYGLGLDSLNSIKKNHSPYVILEGVGAKNAIDFIKTHTNHNVVSIYFDISSNVAINRLKERGDVDAEKRISDILTIENEWKDIVKFDYILNVDDTIKNVSDKIIEIKNEQSKKTVHKKPTFK